MGQNQSQSAQSDSPDTGDRELEHSDPDRHDRDQSAYRRDNDSDSEADRPAPDNARLQTPSIPPKEEHEPAHLAFSSQIPGATQDLDPALRSHWGVSKRAKSYRNVSLSSPPPTIASLAKDEIAESPERFIPPSPRPDSPELSASPSRARASATQAQGRTFDELALESSSQPPEGEESPDARRQRKLAKKEKRERKKSQQLAQAATAMADTVFDTHGLDALTAMDHQAYQLDPPMSDELPVISDILPPSKPAKKRKSKKSKASEDVPQEHQATSEGDLNQLVAFTNSSFSADPNVPTEVDEIGDSAPAPASKKRRKSAASDELEKKKKKAKSHHTEQAGEAEEQNAPVQPMDDNVLEPVDQAMEDTIESPTVSKKKRKNKAKQHDAPESEVVQMQIDQAYVNGNDHGLMYGVHDESANDMPSYQPEPVSPYNPGHMSLDEIARAISSSNIQASYGAPNIPIDPELAKYENTQDHGDLLGEQHYAPAVPMHGLDVPMETHHMHVQYGNYEEPPMDVSHMNVQVPTTPAGPSTEQVTKSSSRKRVVKPDFYSRIQEDFAELPSPSAAGVPPAASDQPAQTNHQDVDVVEKVENADTATPDPFRPAVRVPKNANVLTGPFSDFELRNITEAIDKWRVENGMSQFEINAFIHGNPKDVNSSEFWNRVISTCPNRRRQKVINQCRRKFHNFVARGTWTPEQHDELSKMWEMHGNKYTLIGSLINRHPEDVRDRIRNYVVCGDNRRKDAWSQEEEDRLANIVAEAIDTIRRMREKGESNSAATDEELVDWQMVSEKMDRTRSRLQCITKWKLIKAQLEGGAMDGEVLTLEQIIDKARREAEGMTDRDRYNVVKAIKSCGAQADSRIPWAKVRAEKVGDKWSRATLMLVWHRLKVTVPDWKLQSVSTIADYLCNSYGETSKLQFLAPEHLDLDNEYEEIERKVSKIIKAHNRPKTSSHLVDQEDLDDDVGAMDVSQFPLADDEKPVIHGGDDDPTGAIQSQLEEPKTEDAVMGNGLDSQQDLEASAGAAGSNGVTILQANEYSGPNGDHEPANYDNEVAQQEHEAQSDEAISHDVLAQAVVEDAINAGFDMRKTPKSTKTYSASKKTPSTSKSEHTASSRRSSKKANASQRSKKAAATTSVDDANDGSSNSSGSDDEDIPSRV